MQNILLIDCPDQTGLVHHITGVLYRHQANIVSNHEFVDAATRHFYMRTAIEGELDQATVHAELTALLPDAVIRFARTAKPRIVVLATKEHHCLGDLLIRNAFGDLNAELVGVIANHSTLQQLVERFDVPFHCISHVGCSREQHETAVLAQIAQYQPDYVVLAKYMRIISPQFVAQYPQRLINIHHSFLPAFIGANPYRQAFERGVKIIGATAHFVSNELDEGPIIAQAVIPVDHSHSVAAMMQAGHDVETMVLARALRLVFEERVFLAGNRTIIFD